jgi:DnaK suppressor protein
MLMDNHRRMDRETIKARLSAQRASLLRLMEGRDEGETPELDKTRSGRLTRMDELHSQAMSAESVRRRKLELVRIEAALRRLEAEEYGYCSVCGEAIGAARLGVDPAAEQCIRCATLAEQGGKRRPQMNA